MPSLIVQLCLIQRNRISQKTSLTGSTKHSFDHKVDKTEGASDQFPIWIFNFWPYGQLRAVMGKNPIMNYE